MSILPRPADPTFRPTPSAELEHLRRCWGRFYQVDYDDISGEWTARHLSSGEQMISQSPIVLRTRIRDDYTARRLGLRGNADLDA